MEDNLKFAVRGIAVLMLVMLVVANPAGPVHVWQTVAAMFAVGVILFS
jgi:hypothetical protein